jgi:oligoendopeptidase F
MPHRRGHPAVHPRLSWIIPAALALAAGAACAQPAVPDSSADARLVWDLTRLFPTEAAWDAERQAIAAELPSLRALKDTLGQGAAPLRTALDRISAVQQRLRRVSVYASTQTSTDYGSRRNQERSALVSALGGEYNASVAWVDPELQALGAGKLAAFRAAEPGLHKHGVRLRHALRQAPHTLSPEAEAAVAALAPVLGSFSETRELLINADVAWPTLVVDGQTVRLSNTGYERLRAHADRSVRRQAFDAFWKTYGQYENTLGTLLAQRVQQGVINARLRRYPSAAAASLASTEVPETVLRTLVAEANRALPVLHRYFRLRQKLLKLPDLHYYDIYPDLVTTTQRYPVAESSAITLAAMKPLGDEYQGQLAFALQARTMHALPAPGKRSGAYANGAAYGQTPYIFLNHTDSFESLVTFAHEWGHGMHAVLSQRTQPPESSAYPLFLAEIASITNEVLLTDHMLQRATAREERLFVLTEMLERLRASFFRQTMFAEFELMAHDAQQRGEPLSGRRFTEMYCGLLRKYHGADAGVMIIDPLYCREWAYIPHFHRPFYVYAYATSTAAAQHFGTGILAGRPGAREAYLDVLRSGGSTPPHELLLKTGLDLTSPAPYAALVTRMNALLDEVEALVR